jgi:hypothetical protein
MPALDNPRHERFAFAIFAGLSADTRTGRAQSTAYRQAYPNCAPGHSAEVAASRLLRRVEPIMARVRELQAESLARQIPDIDFSRDRVGRRLDKASQMAEKRENPSAMATCELGIAKVFGHVTDKVQDVTQRIKEANTMDEIAAGILANVGVFEPSAEEITQAIEAHDVFMATMAQIAAKHIQ